MSGRFRLWIAGGALAVAAAAAALLLAQGSCEDQGGIFDWRSLSCEPGPPIHLQRDLQRA